ncbi:MAG: hypothetical protein EOO25_01250 [Comamonadaceae bacterium]|nr:MAG: hypothetical protein EOO25_01250 [Comamonadaceae bacterium]
MKTLLLLLGAAGVLAACSEKSPTPAAAPSAAAAPAMAPAPQASPPGAMGAAPATTPANSAGVRSIPLSIQGVASAGVTVRVKNIELGEDATVLKVSISYASRIASSTTMALTDTFLEDEKGHRLMLKRPESNRDLSIRDGDTMDGELVFLGAVAPGTTTLKLVFNESNQPDNVAGPGLVMQLPLPPRS